MSYEKTNNVEIHSISPIDDKNFAVSLTINHNPYETVMTKQTSIGVTVFQFTKDFSEILSQYTGMIHREIIDAFQEFQKA